MKNEDFGKCFADAGVSALISVGIAVILTFILGAVAYSADDPGKLTVPLSVFIVAVAFVAAGIIGAVRGNGFLTGFVAGALLFVLLFLISLFFNGENAVTPYSAMPYSLAFYLSELVLSAVGAFFVSSRQRKKHSAPRVPKIKHK